MKKVIDLDLLDTTVSPQQDFYQFVNGGWLKKTEIPADRSSWGSFHELGKETDHKVLELLRDALAKPGPDPNKAARLFESGMDRQQIETTKLSAIKPLMEKIEATSIAQLPGLIGELIATGYTAFLHLSVHPDLGNSKMYAAYLESPDLGLPEREYYLEHDEKTLAIQHAYLEYISAVFQSELTIPEKRADKIAQTIFSIEQQMAEHMMPKEERRQVEKLYNKLNINDLNKLSPRWNWTGFFSGMSWNMTSDLIATEPDYLAFFDSFIQQVPMADWKNYLRFVLINKSAPYAHSSLEQAHFKLYATTLQGVSQMKPRDERLVKVVNNALGESLGQLFVSKHFPPAAKQTALEMVDDIVRAFRSRIRRLKWMSPDTKKYALEKLKSFRVKIGYPDQWETYKGLEILSTEMGGSFLQNMLATAKWRFSKDVSRINREVDRKEWFMAPQVVNAYYHPMFNEIVFPAAILQPPFFDWKADAAVNYGGIGAVIGHEITHGFDDQGSKFDKEGNLNEWWSEADRKRFQSLTQGLIEQTNQYKPFDDLALNGAFTLGENIADLGGLSVAYDALQLYYKRHPKPGPIDGFSPEQRFFMSWATVWRTKIRPEALRTQIKTDPHPPGQYRAIAAPSNMEVFYRAFRIPAGSKTFVKRKERIQIW